MLSIITAPSYRAREVGHNCNFCFHQIKLLRELEMRPTLIADAPGFQDLCCIFKTAGLLLEEPFTQRYAFHPRCLLVQRWNAFHPHRRDKSLDFTCPQDLDSFLEVSPPLEVLIPSSGRLYIRLILFLSKCPSSLCL